MVILVPTGIASEGNQFEVLKLRVLEEVTVHTPCRISEKAWVAVSKKIAVSKSLIIVSVVRVFGTNGRLN